MIFLQLFIDTIVANFISYIANRESKQMLSEQWMKKLGYKHVFSTEFFDDTSSEYQGYQADIFINHEKKNAIIANPGSVIYDKNGSFSIKHIINDLFNDIQLFFNFIPIKFYLAQKLNREILMPIVEKYPDYNFIFTGHSLGAVISDLQAADINRKINNLSIYSITFENPGSKKILQKLCHNTEEYNDIIQSIKYHAIQQQNKNFINCLHESVMPALHIQNPQELIMNISSNNVLMKFINNNIISYINFFWSTITEHGITSFLNLLDKSLEISCGDIIIKNTENSNILLLSSLEQNCHNNTSNLEFESNITDSCINFLISYAASHNLPKDEITEIASKVVSNSDLTETTDTKDSLPKSISSSSFVSCIDSNTSDITDSIENSQAAVVGSVLIEVVI
ncbi:lipase family protein [Rickettsia endosymbiont of Cardiosporidium cionae]|uniref:lipase family protein n=1 Tax=Rickettsia endosymbiont of Cardiosporidium cionae TaxID=2777155 RepID=UPI001895F53A|nr:hypothetical protein [Rickettsia endosymbiont of Cardiosporidium cionae]KAF8818861.1 hypothetical protein IHI24_000095 [Rickettsia endosymbiont of Cardiosporidium cionae]